ncbi:hypothetical protein WN71_007835 [Streptomyces mangrovisoli]|uniref:Uncharacterized protein n=1 Tax=Streptomyces mangrovisoli TaxID=1428628 RepID=A0A1J4P4D5_9ACTN|nr:hypothetical protein [Streptomyces mangrovisoli]OIJ68325.1 hypothetical protein WN71_007835 [Streptomyces mangrovisoli]
MTTAPPPEQPDKQPDGQPEFKSSITDEQWEAFQREVAAGGEGAAAPAEPSARARMVARQLGAQDEAARSGGRRRWRRRKAAQSQPASPPGWRTGPAWQEFNRTRSRGRQAWSAVGVLLAVALALVAVRPSLLLDRLPGHAADAAAAEATASQLPAETVQPSSAPSEVDQPGLPTLDHPFLGSPAASWADGADAIELPTAKAVGGLSKEDVALALRRTKEFLVATSLNPAVLRGGQPDKAFALLNLKDFSLLSQLHRALDKPTRTNDPLTLFSRFDPDEVKPAGDVVKVRGHMTFAAAESGQVRVQADYTFVYPLVKADGDSDVVARTIIRREVKMILADPKRWTVTPGRMVLEQWNAAFYNDECGIYDGYFHPTFPLDTASGSPATGKAEDPYDRSHPLSDGSESDAKECGTTTRT